MSYSVTGNTIHMTRGDTVKIRVALKYKQSGQTYTPQQGDEITFTAVNPNDKSTVIVKTIPTDTLLLSIAPEDTSTLPSGLYQFDIQLTFANGDIDTFITDGALYVERDLTE